MTQAVGALAVVLLNPALSAATVTERNVTVAGHVLGAAPVRLVNLCVLPTVDLPALSRAAVTDDSWHLARGDLIDALMGADILLFAYGLGGFVGPARRHFCEQVLWLHAMARRTGHRNAFMVDRRPRHPSRWRQYLGPRRGLFREPTFEERLRTALRPEPLRVALERSP